MKKLVLWIYTVLRVIWVPLAVAVPLLTVRQIGEASYSVAFPAITLVPLFLILEFVLRRRYRKDFSTLSTKYWLVTGLIGWLLTVLILLMALPGWPLHNDSLHTPGNIQSAGFVIAMIIFGSVLTAFMIVPEIVSRKRTVTLYKKADLFK
jgi:hypothetical protein